MATKELNTEELFNELLEKNIIERRLKNDKIYQDNLVKLDFSFYLLKRYIPKHKINVLLMYEELSENINLTEKHEIFKEGVRQAGFR